MDRGLQTTSTFIHETGDFEMNTPCIGATKWWSGALGRTASHAVVHARLLIPEKGNI